MGSPFPKPWPGLDWLRRVYWLPLYFFQLLGFSLYYNWALLKKPFAFVHFEFAEGYRRPWVGFRHIWSIFCKLYIVALILTVVNFGLIEVYENGGLFDFLLLFRDIRSNISLHTLLGFFRFYQCFYK